MKVKSTKDIGKIVREFRKLHGMTQEQLASICGLGRRFIVDLEHGKETCEVGKALHVLASCGITLDSNWMGPVSIEETKKGSKGR